MTSGIEGWIGDKAELPLSILHGILSQHEMADQPIDEVKILVIILYCNLIWLRMAGIEAE